MSSRRPRYQPTQADLLYARAFDAAQHPDLAAIAANVRADASPQTLSEVGGLLAGGWYGSPGTSLNHELIAAGMILTGRIDHSVLLDWVKEGIERTGARGARGGTWSI